MSEYLSEGTGACAPCGVPCGAGGLGAFDFAAVPWTTVAAVVAIAAGGYFLFKKFGKKRRHNRRRRNAPFRVKYTNVVPTIGSARSMYAALPSGGYRSLIDVNQRKGRSGRYRTRKILSREGRP